MKYFSVKLSVLTLAMLMNQANARIPGRGASPSAGPSGGTDINISNPGVGVSSTVVSAGSAQDCDPRDTGGYVSMNFLRNIVDPSVASPGELQVVEVESGKYQVQMAKHINACADLDFEVTKADNNYFIRVKNNFEFTPENVPVQDGEKFENLSFDEKYYRCVEAKGLLKNGAFDRIKAEQSGAVSYGKNSNPFSVDVGNGDKSVTAYFGSPKATAYGPAYEAENVNPKPSGWSCVSYENFSEEESRLFTSRRDRVYDRALGVCEKENAEEILEELSRLRSSSAGNFRDLENILENAYEKAKDKRVEEIYGRMDEIEKAMKPDSDGEMVSESTAEEYAKEYSALSKELSRIVIQPATRKVTDLLQGRTNENKEQIDAEVAKLNKQVQEFSNRDFNSLSQMYDVLKEYNLTKEARDIEGLRLASHHYGRVYKGGREEGRGKSLSLEEASEQVKKKIGSFEDKVLADWTAQYEIKRGNKRVLSSAKRGYQKEQSDYQRLIQTLSKRESDSYKKACATTFGMYRNRNACDRWHKGREARARRYQSQMNASKRDLTRAQAQYFSYNRLYSDYMADLEERRANSGYDEFSYYDGNNYDFYYDGGSYDSYDDSYMFQMGGGMSSPFSQMRMPATQGFYQGGMMPQQQMPMNGGMSSPFNMGHNPFN